MYLVCKEFLGLLLKPLDHRLLLIVIRYEDDGFLRRPKDAHFGWRYVAAMSTSGELAVR
jgi:hypothetical protein